LSVCCLRCPEAPRPVSVRPCLLPCKRDCIVTPFSDWTECPTSCEPGTLLFYLSVCLSLYYIGLSVHSPSVCLCLLFCNSVCVSVCLSLSFYPSIHLSVYLSLCLSVCLSTLHLPVSDYRFVILSVCLSVCLFVCLFVCYFFSVALSTFLSLSSGLIGQNNKQFRYRVVIQMPANGGQECPDTLYEEKDCATPSVCPGYRYLCLYTHQLFRDISHLSMTFSIDFCSN